MTRPIEADVSRSSTSRGKKGKVQTLDKDGQRLRYFADDDRYDLKEMFHREKMSTAEDQSAMMSRLGTFHILRMQNFGHPFLPHLINVKVAFSRKFQSYFQYQISY